MSPIFVVGTGRSGSTIFHRMLCTHPDVAWMNRILGRNPNRLGLHRLYLSLLNVPGLGGWIARNGFTPGEAYAYWNKAYRGFGRPFRDLTADDVTERVRRDFTDAVAAITTSARPRPLIKITGWPRVGFLSEIFEDARFIHIVRDGRSVANSLINVEFWEGWYGPSSWRFGPLSAEHESEWDRHGRSFLVLAALGWKIMMDAMDEAQRSIPAHRFLTIRYEDVCTDPIAEFQSTAEFAGLKWTPSFERRLRSFTLNSQNTKWQTELTAAQQDALNDVLAGHLERLGYLSQHSVPQTR